MPKLTTLGPAPGLRRSASRARLKEDAGTAEAQIGSTGAPSTASQSGAALGAVPRRWPHYQKFDVTLAASPIDGQGVFAAEAIPAGVKIGEIRGEPLRLEEARIRATRYERVMMVEVSKKRAIDFHRSSDPMRYTNHSCAPNARLSIEGGRVEFFSLRPIAVGEEITVRYGDTHHGGRLACRCGAPGCQGAL